MIFQSLNLFLSFFTEISLSPGKFETLFFGDTLSKNTIPEMKLDEIPITECQEGHYAAKVLKLCSMIFQSLNLFLSFFTEISLSPGKFETLFFGDTLSKNTIPEMKLYDIPLTECQEGHYAAKV